MKREYWKTMDARMFDFPGFYTRMAKMLPNEAVLAEVGVSDGTSAIYLAEALLNEGKRFKMYFIDSLQYGGPHQLMVIVKHTIQANLLGCVEILPYDSLVASCRFPDHHFDFVFLDSSHEYEPTKAEIRLWYRKMKLGALLAGHDFTCNEGLRKAVIEIVPSTALKVEETDKNYGLWMVQKSAIVRMN